MIKLTDKQQSFLDHAMALLTESQALHVENSTSFPFAGYNLEVIILKTGECVVHLLDSGKSVAQYTPAYWEDNRTALRNFTSALFEMEYLFDSEPNPLIPWTALENITQSIHYYTLEEIYK